VEITFQLVPFQYILLCESVEIKFQPVLGLYFSIFYMCISGNNLMTSVYFSIHCILCGLVYVPGTGMYFIGLEQTLFKYKQTHWLSILNIKM
jgi:hypothetical protein